MPALWWCGRRWRTGSDDFVIFGTVHATANFLMSGFYIYLVASDRIRTDYCPGASTLVRNLVIALAALYALGSIIFAALTSSSLRGRILEESKRWLVGYILYVVFAHCLLVLAANSALTHVFLTQKESEHCNSNAVKSVMQAVIILTFVLNCVFLLMCAALFNPEGGGKNGGTQDNREVWTRRCQILCCCCRQPGDDAAIIDAAQNLAIAFQGYDVVPSDIAAGLVLLSHFQQQALDRKVEDINYDSKTIPDGDTSALNGRARRISRGLRVSREARRFHPLSDDHRKELFTLIHFSKFYLASYGWLLYWYQHLITGLPHLWASDCCMCCRKRPGTHIGSCCHCDNTALNIVAGLADEDVIFTHFESRICLPCFYVAFDRETNSVVISIRGTMSFKDLITDGVASPAPMSVEGIDGFVHSGMLQSANNIMNILEQHRILPELLLSVYKSNNIVIIGHSLGAGCAAILTLILRAKYPSLAPRVRCLCYGPPGGMMSLNLSKHSEPFILGCFKGKDLVPRLARHTIAKFRDSILQILAATPKSKASVLCCCCCEPRLYENGEMRLGEEEEMKLREFLDAATQPEDHAQLYPPSNMVHLAKAATDFSRSCCCGMCCRTPYYCPAWIDIRELQEILCSPSMVADHMPDQLFATLRETGMQLNNGELDRFWFEGVTPKQLHHRPIGLLYDEYRRTSPTAQYGTPAMSVPVQESKKCATQL